MGNWRTVRIVGTCDEADLPALYRATDPGSRFEKLHSLSRSSGVFGLQDWPGTEMDVVGNLAERDYGVEQVARHLGNLAQAAPYLRVKVHCGGDFQERACVATVSCAGGVVSIDPPEIPDVGEMSETEIEAGFLNALLKARERQQQFW